MSTRIVLACMLHLATITANLPDIYQSSRDTTEYSDDDVSSSALRKLTEVFGIERTPPAAQQRRQPPEYMTNLYRTVAYHDGISKRANPYNADIVRGIPDRDVYQQRHYYFNLSHLTSSEDIYEAEFHLYKLRHSRLTQRHTRHRNVHVINLHLYQIVGDSYSVITGNNLLLLHKRLLSIHDEGWEVFKIRDTVQRWIINSSSNYGLLITAFTSDGMELDENYVEFLQNVEYNDNKQPVLIVFARSQAEEYYTNYEAYENEIYRPPPADSDLKSMRDNYIRFMNEAYREKHGTVPQIRKEQNFMSPAIHRRLARETRIRRRRRSADQSSRYNRRRKRTCQKQEMYVDFEAVGWSGWIISPKGYNAYYCKGECPFPLGQNQRPTNHATVQSIVQALKILPGIDTPCCVPNKLYSISLLYFDDDQNVILKQYDDMVAASCGCH